MAHLLFLVMHACAIFFAPLLLLLTVPLHLIYGASSGRRSSEPHPTRSTHLRCPQCRELVLNEARLCKHCGTKLIPLSEQPSH
jgi:hypothetical protein